MGSSAPGPADEAVARAIAGSLIATIFAFVGTRGALRVMRELWASSDDEVAVITRLLGRFEYWGTFSAVCHAVAFMALVVALVLCRGKP
jgi:hypothetical protein